MVVILLIVSIAIMVLVDIFIIRARSAKLAPSIASPSVFNRKSLLAPDGFYFSKGHVWAKTLGNNKVKAGIDDFVLHALGKILVSEIVPEGSKIKKGDILMKGFFDSKSVHFLSPVDGTVDSVNKELVGKYLSDPYNDDWGLVIKTENADAALSPLFMGANAVNWMKSEFKKLKDFLVMNSVKTELAGVTMYDGGNVMEGAVSKLDDNSVKDFEAMFLAL